jgi:regulator of sigma E protease
MSFLEPAFFLILALSLLVLVHEWGHFYVARRSGVRVLRFSIGFGPELLGLTRGDTRYSICAIPFGGFVKFAGDNPEEEREESSDEFLSQTVGVRSAIVLAGPVMNYVLAIVLFAGALYFGGIETIETTQIGVVAEESVAEEIGAKPDDVILSVNGALVSDWIEFSEELIKIQAGDAFEIEVNRAGERIYLSGNAPEDAGFGQSPLGVAPFTKPEIGHVKRGGPAWNAGLRRGDRILSVDGEQVDRWSAMADVIRDHPAQEIEIEWDREGDLLASPVTPKAIPLAIAGAEADTVGQIGIQQAVQTKQVGAAAALAGGWDRTWWLTRAVLQTLPKLPVMIFRALFRDEDTGLGGPVRMAQLFGEAARWGIVAFIMMMANISTQLAIFNLLPIPVLDGGHLALYLVEVITRRPPSLKVKIILQQIGFALLILLMLSVTVMDVGRFFG